MKLKQLQFYNADSDSDDEIAFTKEEVLKKALSIDRNNSVYSISSLLLNVAQSILENSNQRYIEKKIDIFLKTQVLLSSSLDFSGWKKYLPGLYILNKNNNISAKSKEENFTAYHDRYSNEIEKYFDKLFNTKKQYNQNKKNCLNAIDTYLNKNNDSDDDSDNDHKDTLDFLQFKDVQTLENALFTKIKADYFKTATVKEVKDIIFCSKEMEKIKINKSCLKLQIKTVDKAIEYYKVKEAILADINKGKFLEKFYNQQTEEKKIVENYVEYNLYDSKKVKKDNDDIQTTLKNSIFDVSKDTIKNYIEADSEYAKIYAVKLLLETEEDNIKQANKDNAFINKKLTSYIPKKAFAEDPVERFADFKLNNKIDRALIKEKAIGNITDTRVYEKNLPIDHVASGTIKMFSSGSRSDYENMPLHESSNSAYVNIVNELKRYFTEKSIPLLRSILKSTIDHSMIEEYNNLDYQGQDFIPKFVNLLFNCETERNISAFLTNAMFFELVEANVYQVDDLPFRLPMAIKKDDNNPSGAVPGARYMLDLLGGTYGAQGNYLIKRQYYDFGEGDKGKSEELAARDTAIFLDWLVSKSILNKEDKIEYTDSNDQRKETKLGEAGDRIHNFYKTLATQSTNVYARNTLPQIIKAINHYLADAISDKKSDRSDVEMRGSDEPILIDTSSTQRDKHKAIGDKIFNALHKLVYEWYGIRLDWLYSFDEFKADNKDKFLSEQNNTLTEIIKKISNDKGQTSLRFLSKDDILSAIKIDNEIIIEIYKKEENSNWTVKLPAGFSEELKPAVKQLISALPPENSGDTISLHNITSLLDLIQMKFEKSKYLKDQFEKWVNELWNSQKTYLSSKSSVGLHNDQELLKAAKPVQGFYSDDDVMLLIQALLKLSGFERNNDPKTFGKINDKAVYILNSTSLSDGQGRLDDLARDICKILLMDMGTEKNILIPIRLQHEYHWVTAQLKIGINNRITAYIHDSLYDNKCVHDDIIFQLSDLFIKKEQMNQILGAKNISITFEDEEVQKLNLILNKFDVKKSIVEKIQKETSNVYCGGYTARIIANLVKTDLTEENKKEIWNCNSNKDILLRKNDAYIVNNSNIPNLYLFGTHEQSSDTLHTLSTNAENNRKNQTKHILERMKEDLNSSDQKGEILSKLKEITSTFLFEKEGVLDTKNDLLEATNIYNTLRTLQKNLVENNPLATYLFKHNEESNLELDESGDVIINSDYQPNQLLFLLIETEKHLASSEELHGANQTSKGLTAESINLNLDNIIKSYDQTDIYINSKIVDQRQVYDNILHWLENPNIFNQYASVVKIENTTGQKHAILLHAKKENNKILLTLIDPLSEEDSIFKDELKKLAYSLQQNRIDVEIIYSGKQDKDYGTCADICLIMLQEFIEQTIIYKKMIDNKLSSGLVLYENCAYNSGIEIHNDGYEKQLGGDLIFVNLDE